MDSIEVAKSINPDLLHPIADPRVGSIPWWSLKERDVAKEVTLGGGGDESGQRILHFVGANSNPNLVRFGLRRSRIPITYSGGHEKLKSSIIATATVFWHPSTAARYADWMLRQNNRPPSTHPCRVPLSDTITDSIFPPDVIIKSEGLE